MSSLPFDVAGGGDETNDGNKAEGEDIADGNDIDQLRCPNVVGLAINPIPLISAAVSSPD
jgi:hypothetical protein